MAPRCRTPRAQDAHTLRRSAERLQQLRFVLQHTNWRFRSSFSISAAGMPNSSFCYSAPGANNGNPDASLAQLKLALYLQQDTRAPADMSGYLQKYNSFPAMLAAPWERSWFRLDGSLLSQYRSDRDAQLLGSLNVQARLLLLQGSWSHAESTRPGVMRPRRMQGMTVADEGVKRGRHRTFGIVDHATVCSLALWQAVHDIVHPHTCSLRASLPSCTWTLQGTCLRLSTTDARAATQWIAQLHLNGCELRELNEDAKNQEPLRSMELSAVSVS